jgi:hypothetical protein
LTLPVAATTADSTNPAIIDFFMVLSSLVNAQIRSADLSSSVQDSIEETGFVLRNRGSFSLREPPSASRDHNLQRFPDAWMPATIA